MLRHINESMNGWKAFSSSVAHLLTNQLCGKNRKIKEFLYLHTFFPKEENPPKNPI
jgi:hypothetical protein